MSIEKKIKRNAREAASNCKKVFTQYMKDEVAQDVLLDALEKHEAAAGKLDKLDDIMKELNV